MRRSRNILFTLLALSVCACSKAYRLPVSSPTVNMAQEIFVNEDVPEASSDDEGAVQEPAWTYYERLSYLFGADSTCVGMRNDMDFPTWYSGCFVNDGNRLTINVIGDTASIREMLIEKLGGGEFDLGVGICPKKEQIQTQERMMEAVANKFNGNLTSGLNEDGTINVCIQGSNDSVIARFKKDVFASPILRFTLADEVGVVPLAKTETEDTDEAFIHHETPPEFPGGQFAMLSYIYDNLKYPKEAYDKNIQGRVVVLFLVRTTGKVDSIKIIKSKEPSLDAEALRLISGFPRFAPGKWDDTPEDLPVALPIIFKISDYDARQSMTYPAYQFDNGDDYVEDGMYRIIDENGKIGYADESGRTVITPRFKCAFPFENGKAKVADSGERKEVPGSRGEYHYWESDGWYYIDKTGRKID